MSRARGAEPGSLCRQVRVALLHLAPVAGDVDHNLDSIEHGIGVAVAAGANLIVTPELATTGYSFAERIGTAWIRTSCGSRKLHPWPKFEKRHSCLR